MELWNSWDRCTHSLENVKAVWTNEPKAIRKPANRRQNSIEVFRTYQLLRWKVHMKPDYPYVFIIPYMNSIDRASVMPSRLCAIQRVQMSASSRDFKAQTARIFYPDSAMCSHIRMLPCFWPASVIYSPTRRSVLWYSVILRRSKASVWASLTKRLWKEAFRKIQRKMKCSYFNKLYKRPQILLLEMYLQ